MPAILLIAPLLGFAVGSFLNVVVHRLYHGGSIVRGRSACPACGHRLRWFELIPLVSFAVQRGRCRSCRLPISWQYPLVEVSCGLLFLLLGIRVFAPQLLALQFSIIPYLDGPFDRWLSVWPWYQAERLLVLKMVLLLRDSIVGAILLALFVFDLRYQLLPDQLTLPGAAVAVLLNFALGVQVTSLAIGAAVGAGFFLAQHLVSRGRWIGGGDIRLGLLLGTWLAWPQVGVAIFLAYVSGSAVALTGLALRQMRWKGLLSFGTFLAVAGVAALLWGEILLTWYLT